MKLFIGERARNVIDRYLQRKTDQIKGRVSKISQVKEYVSKNDQLQCIRIGVVFPNECFHLIDF